MGERRGSEDEGVCGLSEWHAQTQPMAIRFPAEADALNAARVRHLDGWLAHLRPPDQPHDPKQHGPCPLSQTIKP